MQMNGWSKNEKEHLVHACCRIMMMLEIICTEEEKEAREAELEALRMEYSYSDDFDTYPKRG